MILATSLFEDLEISLNVTVFMYKEEQILEDCNVVVFLKISLNVAVFIYIYIYKEEGILEGRIFVLFLKNFPECRCIYV